LMSVVVGCASKNLEITQKSAYTAYKEKDYATAAKSFAALVEKIPQDADLWFRLGNSYAKTSRPQKAVAAFENALLRDPGMSKAWYNMGITYLQQSLKAFVDMELYVDSQDPIALQGKKLQEQIFVLLEEPIPALPENDE
ncbi:MAG: tetratricopeptide repeat protein, partial [Desulfopila sp.]